MKRHALRQSVITTVLGATIAAGCCACSAVAARAAADHFAQASGQIEATEIHVATSLPGRLGNILVHDGQFVRAGQLLAEMQLRTLVAEREESYAHYQHTLYQVASAEADVMLRENQTRAAEALVQQRECEFEKIERRLARAIASAADTASPSDDLEAQRAEARSVAAALAAAGAQLGASRVAVAAAHLRVASARSAVTAAKATVQRIELTLAEMDVRAPSDGFVQHRVAQRGEVLGAGDRVLNLVDPAAVYVTFLLSDAVAARVAPGSETRIVLDSAPQHVLVATIASVAASAPLAVVKASAGQHGLRRLKARIDPSFVERHLEHARTGVSGTVWVKLHPHVPWPPALTPRLEQ